MGKRSSHTSMKACNHEKKQQLNMSLIKILRPKVYITNSSNFKNLVQELTGNGNSPVSSPPPSIPISPPTMVAPTGIDIDFQENSLNLSSNSSCFSTPLEGSSPSEIKIDFSSEYRDLETLLMEMDTVSYNYDDASSFYGRINQQEVCVYDYDLSSFI